MALRRQNEAFRRGSFRWLKTAGTQVAYARESAEKTFVVALNLSSEPTELSLNLKGVAAGAKATDVLSPDRAAERTSAAEGGQASRLSLAVPPWGAKVLRIE